MEQCLVEETSLFVIAAPVQLARVLQELEADFDEPGALGEVSAGLVQPVGEPLSLIFDVAELGLDLRLRQGAVGREVDEVLLASVERLKLGLELLVEQPGRLLVLVHDGGDVGPDLVREARSKADTLVVPLDGVLDEQDVHVGRPAGAGLGETTEEVEVLVALRVDRALDGHAAGTADLVAATAE